MSTKEFVVKIHIYILIKYHICFSFLFNSKKLTKKHPSVFSVILEGLRAPPCFWFTVKHHRGVYESPVHTQSIRISMILSSIALIAVYYTSYNEGNFLSPVYSSSGFKTHSLLIVHIQMHANFSVMQILTYYLTCTLIYIFLLCFYSCLYRQLRSFKILCSIITMNCRDFFLMSMHKTRSSKELEPRT